MTRAVPYDQELDRLRGERAVLRGLMQDALAYLNIVADSDETFEPGTSSRTLHWLLGDMRKAIESIERDRAQSIAAPPQLTPAGKQCQWDTPCRERSVMLRRYVASHPGDHIAPEVFERLEQLLPRRPDTFPPYVPFNFAAILNAVLTAGLDAIAAGQCTEYTHRGVTLQLQRRS